MLQITSLKDDLVTLYRGD